MPVENPADLELLASQLNPVDFSVKLKLEGLSAQHLQAIAPYFDIKFYSVPGQDAWMVQTVNREFGTHKIQTVRLLATALLIHHHFPKAKMALMNSVDIELGSPLALSEASQIFLKQAGFELEIISARRTIDASEMTALGHQLKQMHGPAIRRKGA